MSYRIVNLSQRCKEEVVSCEIVKFISTLISAFSKSAWRWWSMWFWCRWFAWLLFLMHIPWEAWVKPVCMVSKKKFHLLFFVGRYFFELWNYFYVNMLIFQEGLISFGRRQNMFADSDCESNVCCGGAGIYVCTVCCPGFNSIKTFRAIQF